SGHDERRLPSNAKRFEPFKQASHKRLSRPQRFPVVGFVAPLVKLGAQRVDPRQPVEMFQFLQVHTELSMTVNLTISMILAGAPTVLDSCNKTAIAARRRPPPIAVLFVLINRVPDVRPARQLGRQ